MIREIKFRAWDKDREKMLKPFSPTDWEADGGYGSCYSPKNTKNETYSVYDVEEDCELMQYTGLKDKNGKEIYEGDIVTHETLGTEGGKYIIEYKDGLHNVPIENVDVVKVIGNIHENKELLE